MFRNGDSQMTCPGGSVEGKEPISKFWSQSPDLNSVCTINSDFKLITLSPVSLSVKPTYITFFYSQQTSCTIITTSLIALDFNLLKSGFCLSHSTETYFRSHCNLPVATARELLAAPTSFSTFGHYYLKYFNHWCPTLSPGARLPD